MKISIRSVSWLSAGLFLVGAIPSQGLDKPPPQVFVGVKIVDVADTHLEGLGVDFGVELPADALNNNERFRSIGQWSYAASGGVMDLDKANAFDVNLGLRVVPFVSPSDTVDVVVEPRRVTLSLGAGANITGIDSYRIEETQTQTIQGMYPDQKETITTSVAVEDRESVIIGGLYAEVIAKVNRVPFLGKIPLVGRLFLSQPVTDHRSELLFFVTAALAVDLD